MARNHHKQQENHCALQQKAIQSPNFDVGVLEDNMTVLPSLALYPSADNVMRMACAQSHVFFDSGFCLGKGAMYDASQNCT